MIKRLLSILPLILFVLIVLFVGYSMWGGLGPQSELQATAGTATPSPTASPAPTDTATPTPRPSVTPTDTPNPTTTATQTPTTAPVSASPTDTPVPTPTPTPSTFVWVETNSEFGRPAHTLGLVFSEGENPVLQQYAAAPVLSPDGSKLAFFSESSLSGFNTGIWIADLVGGFTENHKQLADITNVQNMAWSPDGDKVAFEVVLNPDDPREEWQSQIRIVRSNPDDAYVELDRFDGRQPAWSPDSQNMVFYTCRGSQCGLFVVDCTGGNCAEEIAEQITFDSTDSYPSWSPNGSIAFASMRDGNHEIYLWLPDDSLVRLTNRPSIDTTPIFNATGRKIFFRTDHPDALTWKIQVITLADNGRTVQSIDTLIDDVGGDNDWGLAQPAVR